MVEITNREELKAWLEGRPRAVAILIAARAALRAIPFLKSAHDHQYQDFGLLTCKVFRACAISWTSVAGNNRAAAADAVAAYGFSDASVALAPVDHAADAAAKAADAVAYATSNVAADVVAVGSDAVAHAVAAANAYDTSSPEAYTMWRMVREDASFVNNGRSIEELTFGVLSPLPASLRPTDGELFMALEENSNRWKALKIILLNRTEDWDVWTDWYEDRLDGKPQNLAFEKALLSLADEDWEQEPAIVNARLKELMNADKSRFLAQAGFGATPSDLEGTVLASDRFVSVRDNQEPFDVLEKSLDQIRDEFARDHNKQEYLRLQRPALLKVIEEVLSQIKAGWVKLSDLRDRLRPELMKLKEDCEALNTIGLTILGLATTALGVIAIILKLVG